MCEWESELVYKWVSESVSKWVSEWVSEWVSKFFSCILDILIKSELKYSSLDRM